MVPIKNYFQGVIMTKQETSGKFHHNETTEL